MYRLLCHLHPHLLHLHLPLHLYLCLHPLRRLLEFCPGELVTIRGHLYWAVEEAEEVEREDEVLLAAIEKVLVAKEEKENVMLVVEDVQVVEQEEVGEIEKEEKQ